MIRKISIMIFVLFVCCTLQARPLNIIIVTSKNSSENGYFDFLRAIYLDNANIEIDDDRYKENSLTNDEKQQLRDADLIIVSSDNSGGDYNADSAFWASLPVPILSHNISLCRSNNHNNWDWFSSGRDTISLSEFYATDPNDPIFDGIDMDPNSITIFDANEDFLIPDEPYSGNGICLATEQSGLPVMVLFDGTEPNYYDGSLYAPNGMLRIYFAMPDEPVFFFENATESAKQLLRNAVTTLLPECWLPGDVDCDRDVDLIDFTGLSADWLEQVPLQNEPPLTDIVPDGQVNIEDFATQAMFWLEGFDNTPPLPDPSEWTDKGIPAIQDGGHIAMKAKKALDDLHGVQYAFKCIEDPNLSSDWQYDRDFSLTDLPIGIDLSFQTQSRDTSSRFNETMASSIETVRTDGLFYYAADASAAVALDDQHFIMADDEFNILQVYNWNIPGSDPNTATDISAALTLDAEHPEADIEGATWFNNRIFWIGSHGRSKDGEYWQSRYNFFATTIAPDGSVTAIDVYDNLINDLIQYDQIWNLGLEAAIGTTASGNIRQNPIPDLAPKVNGLNIEGLCTTADGSKMFIGFRNPQVGNDDMALVIPIANPEAVVVSGADPNLEEPILIDLNELGIRSMEYSPNIGEYLIVAGSHRSGNDDPNQVLYNYSIVKEDRDKLATFSDDMTPEAIFQFPDSNDINLLSDDGTRLIETPTGSAINKELPREQRIFRTRTIKP